MRHEVVRVEWTHLGRSGDEVSSGSVSVWPAPALTCVAGNGGVRSSEFMPEGSPFHPGATGEGKTGRVNASEPPMMPRDPKPRRWDGAVGCRAGR